MLRDLVFLTQTDTTIGFISQNAEKLTQIKQRPPHKHYIKALPSLKTLKSFARIPNSHKNRVRRSKKTTFIMPNGDSYRVIQDRHHLLLLNRLGWHIQHLQTLALKLTMKALQKRMQMLSLPR